MATEKPVQEANIYNPSTADKTPETLTWAQIIRIGIDQWVRANLRVWLPGEIIALNKSAGGQVVSVDVQLLLQETFINLSAPVTIPPLSNVPVQHYRGKDWWIKAPVAVGDTGRVVFCDRSLDTWLVSGGGPLDPDDTRMHHYSDAVFVPGLYPTSDVLPGSAEDMILHNGAAEIYLQKGGTFKITNGVNELISTLVSASTVAGGPFTPATIAELESLQGE